MTAVTPDAAFEHEARRESLLVLYQQTPTAAVAHVVAAGLVVYAFSVVIALQTLFVWWAGLTLAAPLVYQLMQGGGRVQDVLAGMVILYAAVLLIAVSRLESTFFEGLKLRLQMDALSKTDALTDLANRRGLMSVWMMSGKMRCALPSLSA